VKLYGALLDKEDAAQRVFDAQVKQVQAVEGADTGKTVAYFYINSNGAAVVRRPGDYLAKMIEAAGGHYAFDALGDTSAPSTVTLEMQRFYAQAKDADIIVYNATIDGGVHSLDDLVGKNPLLARFKAVQEGEVWITEHDMYQQMVNTGDIIADFNRAFSGEGGETTYLRKLG
jgi:iron complex transport system substrate-binding protein